jgi:hypothetical protein
LSDAFEAEAPLLSVGAVEEGFDPAAVALLGLGVDWRREGLRGGFLYPHEIE